MKNDGIRNIQLQMKPFLNQGQYLKLTNVLVNVFKDLEITGHPENLNNVDNFELLNSFLSAKEIEGCSLNTLDYYRKMVVPMLKNIDKNVDNISTEDLRKYLMGIRTVIICQKAVWVMPEGSFHPSFHGWMMKIIF